MVQIINNLVYIKQNCEFNRFEGLYSTAFADNLHSNNIRAA